jgi:hypothetical protein
MTNIAAKVWRLSAGGSIVTDCTHGVNKKSYPSLNVLAGGCDVFHCKLCRGGFLIYREGLELVVYGNDSQGKASETRYLLRERQRNASVGAKGG